MPITYTPLRYPGGKSQLRNLLSELLDFLPTRPSVYVEPFCGGAGIAVAMLVKEEIDYIKINDADPGIYSFWYAVLNEPDRLLRAIESIEVTVDNWEIIRKEYQEFKNAPIGEEFYSFELALQTLFLNRTNVSGILEAGCIGGKGQNGKYKIDCRFNKEALKNKICSIASRSERVSLSGLDIFNFMNNLNLNNENLLDHLFFFDPPYYAQGKNLYLNFMNLEEHVKLANILRNFEFPWILTYDNTPEIYNLYDWGDRRSFPVRYSANRRRVAKELMVFSSMFSEFQSFHNPINTLAI